ncbi:MAG TPA: WD40 repeat domain-containing protein, partial [Bacteroidales bacterium]|nr:WD40 repeat domain-containing protein [Bacteroidales bacterium]
IIWNVDTGEILHEFHDSEKDVWTVIFNPSGELLLSSGSDNLIRIYNVETGKLLKTLTGHSMVVLSLAFSPNGKFLASGSDDKTVKIWNTDNWNLLHTLRGENEAIHSAIFIDNNRVLAGGTDKKVLGEFLEYHFNYQGSINHITATLWDIESETILQTITQHKNDLGTRCDVSADGKWLATASSDKTVRLWNIK